jgi:PAS domain S-box-containing protein
MGRSSRAAGRTGEAGLLDADQRDRGRAMLRRAVPIACVAALLGITAGVWHLQVSSTQKRLARHTEDVAVQAARRLEGFVATQLALAGTLAEHWSRHADDEARWPDFRNLAQLMLDEFPSYHAVVLVGDDLKPLHSVAEPDSSYAAFLREEGVPFVERPLELSLPEVSDPYQPASGDVSFFAAWPVEQKSPDDPPLLLVEYRVAELITDCFRGQIRAEFSYAVEDQGETLFQFAHAGSRLPEPGHGIQSVQSIAVQNRTWRLRVMPRPDMLDRIGWTADLSVPVFGFVLSIGVGLLVHLLMLRMERLRVSEARYRGVFDSATEGLLVLAVDGRATIRDANPAAGRLFGFTPDDLIGKPFGDLVPDAAERRLGGLPGSPTHPASLRIDATARRRNGDTLDVEVSATGFIHQDRPAILVSVADVTERRIAARRHQLLSQRALAAHEEERARLARELHDDLGQLLTGLRLELDYLRRQHQRWGATLEPVTDIVAAAIDSVRRLCKGLRPPLLDDLGLESAARQLVDEFSRRTACRVELEIALDAKHRDLPQPVSLCTYRVLQEALTNVTRHAHAGTVRVKLASHDSELFLAVTDDGDGFDVTQLPVTSGLGITGMLERSALVDGRLEITSARLAGTRVELRIPITREPKGVVTP